MTQIGFLEFWEFLWTERSSLWRFLKWTAEMDRYVHPGAKNSYPYEFVILSEAKDLWI
jgi:hypothetical protein